MKDHLSSLWTGRQCILGLLYKKSARNSDSLSGFNSDEFFFFFFLFIFLLFLVNEGREIPYRVPLQYWSR